MGFARFPLLADKPTQILKNLNVPLKKNKINGLLVLQKKQKPNITYWKYCNKSNFEPAFCREFIPPV